MSQPEKRYLPMQYDKRGNPMAVCHMSPSEQTVRAHCVVPPTDVIPVIFVPGFMGSNLKTNTEMRPFSAGEMCWMPDNTDMMSSKVARLNAVQRQLLFSPATTAVASVEKLPRHLLQEFNSSGQQFGTVDEKVVDNLLGEYLRRGWGEVHMGSYARVLGSLEAQLNRIYRQGKLEDSWQALIKQVNALFSGPAQSAAPQNLAKGWVPLAEADLKVAARHWFPVHAFGYNWLQGADDTGKALAKRIRDVINNYAQQGYGCTQAILVTHSAGGLIARAACHPKLGGAQALVLGVVQGVCPTAGVPAIYQRMRTGHDKGIFLDFVKNKVAEVMGKDAAMVTPVLGNSPGALALLPNMAFPAGWLTIDSVGALPKVNPYAEIYQERHAWWRLVREELLNPGQTGNPNENKWDDYLQILIEAEFLQKNTLGQHHHPNTYVHYCAAPDDQSVMGLRWRHLTNGQASSALTGAGQLTEDNLQGEVRVRAANGAQYSYALEQSGRTKGDGTVPAVSASVSEKAVRFSAALSMRFEHTDSYEHRDVIALTLHNITRMAAQA
jgi:hypothetical protein